MIGMTMRFHSKRWAWIFVLMSLLAFLFLASRQPAPTAASAIAMNFIGYTNLPNNDRRFALFSVSNQANYAICWRGDRVEVEGSPNHQGRTINPNLPGWRYAPVLRPGESVEFAMGEPFYDSEHGRWRFSMSFARYSLQARWLDYAWSHKVPSKIGPLVLVESQRLLNPSNHVTASTEWLTK